MAKFEIPSKVYFVGEPDSPLPSRTGGAVRIEDIRAQFSRDKPWTDPDFPPQISSIGPVTGDTARGANVMYGHDVSKFRWIRPFDYCRKNYIERPAFAVAQDGLSAKKLSEYDVNQGTCLGDCYYVASVQALTTRPDVLDFIVPEDNFTGFDDDKYCGAFHFRFYAVTDDKWIDIVVDDLLPVGQNGSLVFADVTSSSSVGLMRPSYAEYWVALLEKAYAKLHGSYKGIDGGKTCLALENFTGGFPEIIDLKKPDLHNLKSGAGAAHLKDQYEAIKSFVLGYVKGDSFMGLSTYLEGDAEADPKGYDSDYRKGLGLHYQHAYTILDAQEVNCKPPQTGSKVLVRIKNPWGRGEWRGAFSDIDDFNWSKMEKDLRQRDESGNADLDEGSFWMDLRDVIYYFQSLDVCHYGLTDGTKLTTVKGAWAPSLQTVGQPRTSVDMLRYTAYKFEVKQGDLAAKYSSQSGGKAIVCYTVAIEGYNSTISPPLACFADLYKVESPDQKLVDVLRADAIQSTQSQLRDASAWTFVDPGTYILVPWLFTGPVSVNGVQMMTPPTQFRGQSIGYAVRVFTENETKLEPWTEAPSYHQSRPTAPDDIQGLLGQFRSSGLDTLQTDDGTNLADLLSQLGLGLGGGSGARIQFRVVPQ